MTTCILCAVGDQPVKMKRQWVHHFPTFGRIIICEAMAIKPSTDREPESKALAF